MIKRMGAVAWWLAALSAGVLLAWAVLLFAWSVHKPWLPGGLDLRLRAVWFWDAVWSAASPSSWRSTSGRQDEGCIVRTRAAELSLPPWACSFYVPSSCQSQRYG